MKNRINLSFAKDKRAQRAWLALVILWAVIRAVVIQDFFGPYGINGWMYLVVDLASAIPYAIYSGKAVINFVDKNWSILRKNALISMVCFYIPDVYVLIYAKKVPTSLLVGFLITIAAFTVLAIWSLRKEANNGKTKL
jgi:hypothetical protein